MWPELRVMAQVMTSNPLRSKAKRSSSKSRPRGEIAKQRSYLSLNELRFSVTKSEHYYLYRVFDFDQQTGSGKVFICRGDLTNAFSLAAIQFKAAPRSTGIDEGSEILLVENFR
jgi:hypothetical protein